MQIVIDIPEEVYYKIAHRTDGFIHPLDGCIIGQAICAGIQLPKGHGKIGDIDELHNIFKNACDAYNINNLAFISDVDMHFDLAPTIIEADKVESEVEK